MPTIAENKRAWTDYHWNDAGEAWAGAWGGSRMLWYGTLLPRLHPFLPAGRVLEIAPGFGRITQYLLQWSDEVIGVDVTERCVDACRARFAGNPRVRIELNDGVSLASVDSASVDLAFSWDSLVHADVHVLRGYLHELHRVLKPGAAGFIHHSNLGAYVDGQGRLTEPNPHFRDTTVTAGIFRRLCADAGLRCTAQELITWGAEPVLNDCFSLFRNEDSAAGEEPSVVERFDFRRTEMDRLGELNRMYAL